MYKQCTDFLCQQLKHPPPTPNLQYHCLHLFRHFSCIPIVPSFYRPLLHQLISPPPPRAVLSLTCFSFNAVPYVIKMYILFHVLEFDPITANRSIDVCVFMRDFFVVVFNGSINGSLFKAFVRLYKWRLPLTHSLPSPLSLKQPFVVPKNKFILS